jgi:hypothetical protein
MLDTFMQFHPFRNNHMEVSRLFILLFILCQSVHWYVLGAYNDNDSRKLSKSVIGVQYISTTSFTQNPPIILLASMASYNYTVYFKYTGSVQTFTVPAGVTRLLITAMGASGGYYMGGNFPEFYGQGAGQGGCISSTVTVTPGQVLNVRVGGEGDGFNGLGGYNGGGDGCSSFGEGGGKLVSHI